MNDLSNNAKGKHGEVNTLLKNFLRYVMTNEPVDDFTKDVARQIVAVKNDPIARRDYMVLATRIKDAKQEGKAEERRETALKMLRKQKPLSEIMEFASMTEGDIRKLAKENGLEVVVG